MLSRIEALNSNLTKDNFIVEYIGTNSATGTELQSDWDAVNLGAHAYIQTDSKSLVKTYNASTGILTISNADIYSHVTSEKGLRGSVTASINVKVYLIRGKIIGI